MLHEAVSVATASVLGMDSNIINIAIPHISFTKGNNGEPYKLFLLKDANTFFTRPVAPRRCEILLDRELFLDEGFLPDVSHGSGVIGAQATYLHSAVGFSRVKMISIFSRAG
jgi:hypothetical protein